MTYDVIVIGGGPAGLAAAIEAKKTGCRRVLVIERDLEAGGILQQCIHNGFGLHVFKEELTGPEYAQKFISMAKETDIEFMFDTMVLKITESKSVVVLSSREGMQTLHGKSIILAMGCRERTRGALAIPGARPAGIFTAGTAQRYINIEGYMVGKKVLILGSGDIGLIMARRLTLEGAEVKGVVELMPYSNGLSRNIVQCLDHYGIPLYLGHTVTNIHGKEKIERITVSKVDENRTPIKGTEMDFDCDTLLLSVGLIPENELSKEAGIELDKRTGGLVVNEKMETSVSGIFACGNVVHVHDLVDFVTEESRRAGYNAAVKVLAEEKEECSIDAADKSGKDSGNFFEAAEEQTDRSFPGCGSDEEKADKSMLCCKLSGSKRAGAVQSLPEGRKISSERKSAGKAVEIINGHGISYTVPQKIETAGKSVDIFMRVNKVFKDTVLSVKSDGTDLYSVKKKTLLPGEMIKMTVPEDILKKASLYSQLLITVKDE